MLGFVSRLVGDDGNSPDESDAGETDASESDTAADRHGREPTQLYECPDCESVYLSADLSVCASCDTGVEPVPSERDLGYGTGEVGG